MQLNTVLVTDENFFLNTTWFTYAFNIFNRVSNIYKFQILVLHKLLLANLSLLKNGQYILVLPFTLINIKLIYDIINIYRNYRNIRGFYRHLEKMFVFLMIFRFPRIMLENSEEECTICREILVNARKLSCSHYYHL